ncbi:MAG: hypothetical protein KFF77_04135 [Bacteroidetes bacterium]|nr:hypothetical protein [Bacteroidota bacterium]
MSCIRLLVLFVAFTFHTVAQGDMPKTMTSPIWPLTFERIASPLGERVLSVASTNDGVIFAGTEGHGIFRSTDGGDSWWSTSLREGYIWPIHVAPGGTLLAYRRSGWMSRHAILRSSDGGQNWIELPDSSSRYFGFSVVRKHGMKMFSEGGGGLHVSTDDGVTWKTLSDKPPIAGSIRDYRFEVLSDSVLFALGYNDVFRSSDGGQTWGRLQIPYNTYSQLLRHPAGGVLVAAEKISGGIEHSELIRVSYDGSVVETIGRGPFWGDVPAGILLDNGDFLAANVESSQTIMRSTDSGRTWVATSGIRAAVSDFCQCPDGTVFAATHGGLYRSHDHGITWEDCRVGSTRRPVTHLFADESNTIFAGTGDAGLFRSSDDCRTWTSAGSGYCGIVSGFSIANNHIIVGVEHTQPWLVYVPSALLMMDWWGYRKSLDISWDGTRTWTQYDFSVDRLSRGKDSLVLTNRYPLNISTDGGRTWMPDSMLWGAKDIKAIQGGIFVLGRNDTLSFRKDGRTEWEFVTTAERGWAIGGDDRQILLLQTGAIRRSTDRGKTWTRTPIEDVRYSDPEITRLDAGHAFAVTGIGDVMLLSKDAGETWKRVVPDRDTRRFVYCALTDSIGRLLLGTDDGLYRTPTGVCISTLVFSFRLGVPYPNLAIAPVMIPYTLEEAGYVRLTIHDITGRERGILHEGYHGPGTYFQGLHHTHSYYYGGAGLYFINLSVNGEVQTQPLVFPE